MTLEEINRRLRQNNPYYDSSQAKKEADLGVNFNGNDISVPETSKEAVNAVREEYNNSTSNKLPIIPIKKRNAFIPINLNRTKLTDHLDLKDQGTLDALEKYSKIKNLENNALGKVLIGTSNKIYNTTEAVKNIIPGAKRNITEFWNYLASSNDQENRKTSEVIRNAFEKNNIPIAENNPMWQAATNEEMQKAYTDKIENKVAKYDKEIQERLDNIDDNVMKKGAELAAGVGGIIPGAVLSMASPELGATYFMGSAGGSYLTDARNKGANEEEALKYATALGIAEGATEMIGIGNLIKGGKQLGKGAIKEALKSYGVNIADNFIQEAMMEPIQESASQMILKQSDWDNIGDRMLSSGIDGALTALIMDGASSGIASSVNVVRKIRNNQQITQNDINAAKNDLNTVTKKITELEENKNNVSVNNNVLQKQITPLSTNAQINYDSKNFATQVDAVRNGAFPKNDMLVLGRTPKVLRELGLSDFPITLTQKHLDTIMNESGKYKGANYHNLGEHIVKKLPDAINNPLDIVKSNTKDDSIVLTTDLSDNQNRTIIASIKIDGKGTVNDIRIDTNVLTSAYGRNNYDKFMQDNIKEGNLLYDVDQGIIKKIDKKTVGERLQLPIRDSLDVKDRQQVPMSNISNTNIIPQNENYSSTTKKILNPTEIANLKLEDVSTTPKLPDRNYKNDGVSKSDFYNNLMKKTGMLKDEVKDIIKNEQDIKYYNGVTNAEALADANHRLNRDGAKETARWFQKDLSKDNVNVSATEVAEGWILLKQYQDAGDYESAVNVAKKMREMATKAGQAVQAYSIQARLTPEGMVQYAQSELSEAFEKISKNKTQEWLDKHKSNFELNPDETKSIIQNVKEAQKYPENSYKQKEKLAEIKKIMTDKLPPEKGAGIRAWMRMSMLFNPKTQVRNVLGNAVIAPVNVASDFVSSIADKALSRKTGVRTTGNTNIVNYTKVFGKGIYESYNDFKKDINTRDINGNRFEIGEGKAFKNKGLGKILNKIDHLLSFMLDVGDRSFYEATFTNSINNQLRLNKTDVITKDMIDIATNEALSRTWQDNNSYTKAVLSIRKDINKLGNVCGYGLGDVFIPFAKTPANLTKAIVDYSPVGLVNTIIEGNNIKKAIGRGDLTAQQQHKFVQDIGKATAGTMLYVLGYSLAKAGLTSGESDEDKDVANFMKNTLGISNYSIKIGDKSFTYDWAQPVAAPFAMMSNLVGKKKENSDIINNVLDTLDVPMNMLLEQSFMSSIKDVFSNYKGLPQGIFEEIAGLPARAVPTFLKQITDMIDGEQRATYEKGKPIQTAVNQVKAKIPGLSKELAPVSDTLGKDVKKYGGNNNIFNVLFNPANVNSSIKSKSGDEIYRLYKKTGDKTIFPRQASYNQIIDGHDIILTSQERYEYQKTTGQYVDKIINELLKSNTYKKLKDVEKAEILTEVTNDANEIAKELLAKKKKIEYERPKTEIKIDELVKNGLEYSNAYIYKTQVSGLESDKNSEGKTINGSSTVKKARYIMGLDTTDKQKDMILSLVSDTDTKLTTKDLKKLNGEYLIYVQQSGKKNDKGISARDKYMMYVDTGIPVKTLNKYYTEIGDIEGVKGKNGKTISGSKKKAIFNYINSLNLSATQKKILFTKSNKSYGKSYKTEIFKYIDSLKLSKTRKEQIFKELYD